MASTEQTVEFTSIPEALRRFQQGDFVIVMDDENRENEGTTQLIREVNGNVKTI